MQVSLDERFRAAGRQPLTYWILEGLPVTQAEFCENLIKLPLLLPCSGRREDRIVEWRLDAETCDHSHSK